MASRMASLIDESTQQAADGAITVVDSHTVKLKCNAPDITIIPGMADYPGAIVHSSHDPNTMLDNPIGTGFMLPESQLGSLGAATDAMRYGNHAMEVLVNDLIKLGAARKRLEIKLFGGAHVHKGMTPIGDRNCAFIARYLKAEELHAVASDLGGNNPRRIHYFPQTGQVKRLLLRRVEDQALLDSEVAYRSSLSKTEVGGSIELFD